MSESINEGVLNTLIEKVTTLAENVAILTAQMPPHVAWTERNIKDHETRLRQLEISTARSAWVPVLVTTVVTAIIVGLAVGFLNR